MRVPGAWSEDVRSGDGLPEGVEGGEVDGGAEASA
jgi:hypothetical protein